MPTNRFQKHTLEIYTACVISIMAQALLLVLENPASRFITDWGRLVAGCLLFATATIWMVLRIHHLKNGWRGSVHFIFNQAVILVGIFFLRDTSASTVRLGGFLLTSLNTALMVFRASANTSSVTSIDSGLNASPHTHSPDLTLNIETLKELENQAQKKLDAEKQKNIQLTYLIELSRQLSDEFDHPISAQHTVNALEKAISYSMVSVMIYEADSKEFITLASSGKMPNVITPGLRQKADHGFYVRVFRQRKTIIVNDTRLEADFKTSDDENAYSVIIAPMLSSGQIKGIVEVWSEKTHNFSSHDIANVEGVAVELAQTWERASYNQRLTDLIQSSISLSTQSDAQACVNEIAILARNVFDAHFVYVTLLSRQEEHSRSAIAGEAPLLLASLNKNPINEPLLQGALNTAKPIRIRDLRKYSANNKIEIDHSGLRSVLVIPIRLHRFNIGAILAFGKQDGVFFTKDDESLADLFSSQAAASVESSWLTQELRTTLQTTSMLRHLSDNVIMADEIIIAAEEIARTAHKTTNANETGIVLLTPEGEIQAKVELDANGFRAEHKHPLEMIYQVMQTGQSIITWQDNGSLVCYPLLTHSRPIGAIWMHMSERESRGHNFDSVRLLANQAAVSLERVNLLVESRRQAKEIEAAYEELEATYDLTLKALMTALDARDRETEGHSMRVSKVAKMLGERIGLNSEQLKGLERGALLHDIGKIGISDTILHKPGKLTDDEWKTMRLHPEIGARIIERIPFLQDSMAVVRYHHERWDGSGYPLGLSGTEIPIESRIFAVADVFDALTSKRSYRKTSTPDEAIHYLFEEAGQLFDRQVVEALSHLPYSDLIQGDKIA